MAIWQNGANANLLDNAAFTDDTNLGAWETISEYAAADGQTAPTPEIGKVNKTETVEGRNSFYDTCKYLGSRINFKEVLRQVVHNRMAGKPLKLVGNNWYTFSFWAKGWQQTISVRQSSSAYGFAKKELYLIAGRTYAISAYGYIDTAAQNEGKTLAIYVYNDDWSESKGMEITKTSYEKKTMEFTPQTTGVYHLQAYMYDDTRPSAGSVYLSSYKVEDNCDLNTYIYPSVVDTDTKVFIDGVETRPDTDLSMTWKLGSSWTKHTVSFKTKSTLAYGDIQKVLFRLLPPPCEEAYRTIYVCMPKLEIGMMATGFIDNASDTKGDRGPALRGPQAWSDCAVGYVFQSGANGEEYKDIVLYGNNYYSCIKSHTKTASNNPGSATDTNSGLWKLADKLEIVATKILLAQYALVKNLGVEVIDMKDAIGNIIFQAKDGNVTCNRGTFNNITVKGNSTFEGSVKANMFYGTVKKVTPGSTYQIDPVNEPYNFYYVENPTKRTFIVLPKAANYEGLEINVFTKLSSSSSLSYRTIVKAQANDDLYVKQNAAIVSSNIAVEKINVEYTNFKNDSITTQSNSYIRFKCIGGAWYAISGQFTGE